MKYPRLGPVRMEHDCVVCPVIEVSADMVLDRRPWPMLACAVCSLFCDLSPARVVHVPFVCACGVRSVHLLPFACIPKPASV